MTGFYLECNIGLKWVKETVANTKKCKSIKWFLYDNMIALYRFKKGLKVMIPVAFHVQKVLVVKPQNGVHDRAEYHDLVRFY